MNIAARRTSMADGPVDRPVPGANDNRRTMLSMGRSLFPSDAVARIYRPSRSATTSAPSRDQWKLVFEARSPSFIEPLMGYTGSRDTLKQVELKFPTLASAIRYAQRQGLCYVVDVPKDKARITMDKSGEKRNTFSDATLGKLGLAGLSDKYRRAMSNDANRNDGDGSWASPMDVVTDNRLPLDARRSILMNWAWTEFLIDQATNEGMPENGRPSRLDEVEQALLALERGVDAQSAGPGHLEAA
ncbi:hypothetical protein ABID44_000614 [Aquamicrobium ahrensii]|uniref:ETC complex I subunit n=2 Tax=Aquamicrobium ahrensii TaxID=469551 RepID=A0ABV2KGW1_9HYPH